MKKILYFLMALSLSLPGLSQSSDVPLTPVNDPHWELKFEENFDKPGKTTIEWNTNYSTYWRKYNYFDFWGKSPTLFLDSNVYVENGKLVLKIEKDSCQCPDNMLEDWQCKRQHKLDSLYDSNYYYRYTGGFVETRRPASDSYGRFGYIEAKVNFHHHRMLNQAFWTNRMNHSYEQVLNEAEIDIEQMGTIDSWLTNNSNVANTQNYTTNGIYRCYDEYYMVEQEGWKKYIRAIYIPNYSWEYGNWHKYAIEWSPTRIIWYIDDKPVRELYNHGIEDTVRLIFNTAVNDMFELNQELANFSFPILMEVDSVRVYQLKKECDSVMQVCGYDFSDYDNTVKRKIIIGDGNCSNTISTRTILRASESVELNENFTLEEGVELYIDVDGCIIEDVEDIMQYKCADMGASEYE
jgi:beta-glucanase (GH16 family)